MSTAPAAPVAVTVDNFKRVESDHYFQSWVDKGCLGKFYHERGSAAVADQKVVRLNRDTPYSWAVFDLTTPVTITLPDAGTRFLSMLVINQDHYDQLIAYAPGSFTITQEMAGTRYVCVLIRTFMDPNDPADMKAGHAAQDAINVVQASIGAWERPNWDEAQRQKLTAALAGVVPFVPDSRGMFGKASEVDQVRHLLGTAGGWAGNPIEAAKYVNVTPKRNDGTIPHVLTVKEVPVDGFWSITLYNAKGYYEAPESAISLNNVTGTKNADGSMTVHFGGDPKAANYLRIMPGWNYTVRLYRPRAEIIAGTWNFPEPVPVQ